MGDWQPAKWAARRRCSGCRAVEPLAQAVVQYFPFATLDPSTQDDGLAAFKMPIGAEHEFGEQENVDGDNVPALQLRDEGLAM